MDISTADQGWQRWWFSMPAERRAHIEGHLEVCRTSLEAIGRLDMEDRAQHPMWKQLRVNSGWSIKKLAPCAGLDRTQLGRYEGGKRLPSKQVAPRYRALLWNLATDQYHTHLVRLAWALFWAEQRVEAPELVEATEVFLDWSTSQRDHPLLGALPIALPHDPAIQWPIQVEAA